MCRKVKIIVKLVLIQHTVIENIRNSEIWGGGFFVKKTDGKVEVFSCDLGTGAPSPS